MRIDELSWPADGLLPVAIVDAGSGDLLTLAYVNRLALERTIATRETHLYSRSRQSLWRKGETSGNVQRVVAIDADCDGDALVYRVIPSGPACHTGARSCFFNPVLAADTAQTRADGEGAFARAVTALDRTIASRRHAPSEGSYTASLFAAGTERIAQKVGEEAVEAVVAAVARDRDGLVNETADLFYHTLVLLAERDVSLDEVGRELARRAAPRE